MKGKSIQLSIMSLIEIGDTIKGEIEVMDAFGIGINIHRSKKGKVIDLLPNTNLIFSTEEKESKLMAYKVENLDTGLYEVWEIGNKLEIIKKGQRNS